MKVKQLFSVLSLTVVLSLSTALPVLADRLPSASLPMPDALPASAPVGRASKPADPLVLPESMEFDGVLPVSELTLENLLAVLEKYDVKCPRIVAAQAILETGHFTSQLCMEGHNLFGLRHPSDGSYYVFDNWEQSVKAYRDDVQYKYDGGDYYTFLRRIGYAEDKGYTGKVRRIAEQLDN